MTQNHPLKIGIVCGEHSGDRLGAELITELKRTHDLDLFGVGGPKLEALGVRSLFDFSEINIMGLIDPLINYRKLSQLRESLIKIFTEEKIDFFIGIDSPDFNIGIHKALKTNLTNKNIQIVSPSVWGWRQNRIKSIKKYIDLGVEKVILGSGGIKNKEFLKESCEKFKGQIALGLDAKDGNLSVSGWKENLNIKTIDFLKEVNSYGMSRIIYTDINRDGMKTSPNLDDTVKIAELSNCPVVISGGVSSINDIKKVKELNNNKIEGIIVGKAIYDGDIKLDELAKEIDA